MIIKRLKELDVDLNETAQIMENNITEKFNMPIARIFSLITLRNQKDRMSMTYLNPKVS